MTPAKRPSTRARQTPIQSLDDLQPDPLNANRGTDRGREALRRSLHTYGAGRSIVIDKRGRILGGHKTVEQAKHLGLPVTVVPTTGETLVVVQRVDLDARTDPRAQELALADNRVAELDLDWDPVVLRQLEQAGVALEAFWTPEEFARLLAPEGPEAQPDENTVLAPPTTTTIRRGDVFQLGRHRLACGDATAATDVARLLAGATPCLMVTDPPYGVNYQPAFRHTAYPRQRTAVGRVTNDTQADWAAAYALFPGDVAYVWHAALFADVVMAGLRQAQFEVRSQIIWAKPTFVLGRGAYHWQHEPVWFAVRQGRAAPWYGGRTQSTVWEVPNLNAIGGSRTGANTPTGHATQKPVRVFEIPILNHTTAQDAVYDPFVGSGTTLIAGEKLGRPTVCHGCGPDLRGGRPATLGSLHRPDGRPPHPGARPGPPAAERAMTRRRSTARRAPARGGQQGYEPPVTRMRRDERILELALERWSQRQIAAEVGLTQGGVSKALRRIFTRQLATLTEETEPSRVKLVLLAERRARAAREGHARSQADVTTRRQRKVAAGGGAAATTVVELDTQSAAGNPNYLAVEQRADEFAAKLLGLYDPPRTPSGRAATGPRSGRRQRPPRRPPLVRPH